MTKPTHSRRNFLAATGVAIGLPLLESFNLRAYAQESAAPRRRMVAVNVGLGIHAPNLIPQAAGRDYETLRRDYLASFRARHETLVEAGLGHREQLHLDLQPLERDFPPPAPAAGM